MKRGRLQCKDIDDVPILLLLARNPGQWHHLWEPTCMPSVVPAFPEGTPDKLMRAKMISLVERGLVDGCTAMHNCRGDFHITDAGMLLVQPRVQA